MRRWIRDVPLEDLYYSTEVLELDDDYHVIFNSTERAASKQEGVKRSVARLRKMIQDEAR